MAISINYASIFGPHRTVRRSPRGERKITKMTWTPWHDAIFWWHWWARFGLFWKKNPTLIFLSKKGRTSPTSVIKKSRHVMVFMSFLWFSFPPAESVVLCCENQKLTHNLSISPWYDASLKTKIIEIHHEPVCFPCCSQQFKVLIVMILSWQHRQILMVFQAYH